MIYIVHFSLGYCMDRGVSLFLKLCNVESNKS